MSDVSHRSRKLSVGIIFITAVMLFAAFVISTYFFLQPPKLHVPVQTTFALPGVTIINPGARRTYGDLLVRDGRILEIHRVGDDHADTDHAVHTLAGYEGMFVLPGLIDMHVHFPPKVAIGNQELFALLFLAHGITTVRDMGSVDGSSFNLREKIRNGEMPGPRLFTCGKILDGDPPVFPSNRVVHDVEEAKAAVRELAKNDADFIKVYNRLTGETLTAIRESAAEFGLPVLGHTPNAVAFEMAMLDEVQHLTGVPHCKHATLPFDVDYHLEDWLEISDQRIDSIIEISKKQGIAHTPTLVNLQQRKLLGASEAFMQSEGLQYLPVFWADIWQALWRSPYVFGSQAEYEIQFEKMQHVVQKLHEAGVPIFTGTDTMMPYVAPGASLHGELRELIAAGFSIESALRAATVSAGQMLPQPKLGAIASNAPADFLIFDEDPTLAPNALTGLKAVIAAGRLYTREWLDDALAKYQQHFRSEFYENVMGFVVGALKGSYTQ